MWRDPIAGNSDVETPGSFLTAPLIGMSLSPHFRGLFEMRRVPAIVVASAAALTAASASADEWSDQVQGLIEAAAETYLQNGYHYGGYTHEGSLGDGESERLTIRIGAGMETQLIGACDTDCSDFDLTVYDSAGREADSDLELDDFPIVSITPRKDGVYTILVQMIDCEADPCRYAIQQFVK
jgi:hypothetical protein